MLEAFLYALPFGLALAFSAGPIFFVVIETSINKSKTRALMISLGALTADVLYIFVAYFGSRNFLDYIQNNSWVSIISGLGISVFGMVYFLAKDRPRKPNENLLLPKKRLYFLKGFAINFLNVAVLIYWVATTIAIGSRLEYNPSKMIVFYTSTLGSLMFIEIFKIYFANKFRQKFKPKLMRKIKKIIGLILTGFGVFIIVRSLWF